MAELMKHRAADSSKRYRILSEKFIKKYGFDTSGYDVIRGWRADASYFYITKAFVRDEIDIDILQELFTLGDLGIQYCLKSEKSFQCLREEKNSLLKVDFTEFNKRYTERDRSARMRMKELINSDKNRVEKVFSSMI